MSAIEKARAALNNAAEYQEPGAGAISICLAGVKPERLKWLWPRRIPLGKLTILAGDPGLGKSLLTAAIATHVSTGYPWPVDGGRCAPGNVVILSAEDDPGDTLVPRLLAAKADLSRIHMIQAVRREGGDGELHADMFSLQKDLQALSLKLHELSDVRLLIVDPVSAYLGNVDSHSNAEVRGLLAPLSDLAQRHQLAAVMVSHLNKGNGSALYRVTGSLAFVAAARAAFLVAKDPDDSDRRLVIPQKNNLGPDGMALAYRVGSVPTEWGDQPILEWEPAPVEISADEALTPKTEPGPEAGERREAEQWLRQALADGPRLQKEIIDEAVNGADLTKRTLERAKKNIGVESFRKEVPGPWWWRLSQGRQQAPTPQEPGDLGDLGGLAQNQQLTQPQECQHRQDRQDSGSGEEPGDVGVSATIEQAISGLPITAAELLVELDPEDLADIRSGEMQSNNIRALAESLLDHAG